MAVNIDQLTTEVTPEAEASAAGGVSELNRWEVDEQARETDARVRRDRCRTAAEGFDD